MVRSKIKYELIADERTRRETFRKRKTGLFKKLSELKTLCEVEACGIVISGDGTQAEVWPSPNAASQVIQKFINLPTSSQTNNMIDQAGFLRANLSRYSKNLDKESKKIESLERELRLAECLTKEEVVTRNTDELHEILRLLERKIGMVDRRIAKIEPSSSNMAASAQQTNNEPDHGKGKQPV
ncbi:hypothetical protein CDL12_15981 [Handroanthus impetiginosus]|uniref:MADS-box domain-containing protein n=1 Tax=Handroanthus impetiginosus TaxID=429701 RepID=A0A2G9H1K6_9LAMI|nr:hypothetical protein CDL12_15981 [Handroanthus impetiginosus]